MSLTSTSECPSLSQRSRRDERMDDPHLAVDAHQSALRGLQRLNAWSRSWRLLWPQIVAAANERAAHGERLRVMDVATGSGDGPLAMACRARSLGLPIDWVLCDRSSVALDVARRTASRAQVSITAERIDVLRDPLPVGADVVTCSLFLHHLDDDDAVSVLRRMADAAAVGIAAADLDRSRGGLLLAWVASRVLSRSAVVHTDAVLSVRGAFTIVEAQSLAARANLHGAVVHAAWPQRWVLSWRRTPEVAR